MDRRLRFDLCVVEEYDIDVGVWAGTETVSKERFEEDLVGKRADDRNTPEVVGGNGDEEEGKVSPADGGLLEEEEWGGYT